VNFSGRELRDLAVAWVALGAAFTFFFAGGGRAILRGGDFLGLFVVSMATAGVGFLLHEIAHKVVAVRFGQIAEFRADYGMLFLAIAVSLAGWLFAAPGAVHHRGRLTDREHGLIALAGPVTNLLLALLFLPVWVVAPTIGGFGVAINLLLAGFNMLPFGPLDGRTVFGWSKVIFAVVFLPSAGLALFALLLFPL
jgi:Zn-dependent protease